MTGSSNKAPAKATTGSRIDQIRLTEVFLSLQGESTSVGLPTVFVRLTGCPLRCGYCDTAYAFHGGTLTDVDEVLERVAAFDTRHVTVTGGEPLAQPGALGLMTRLADAGHEVSLETSGALDVSQVDVRVRRIVDIKTPGSGEVGRNRWENLSLCTARDELKFVITSRSDYEWAKLKCDELGLYGHPSEVLFSPAAGELSPRDLADWIIADRIPVRLQIQLHKLLWGDEPGR